MRWNGALASRFFARGDSAFPRYLAVDDDVLDDLTADDDGGSESGADSFARAVRSTLGEASMLFRGHIRSRISWRAAGHEVPPYLGLLGLCVLAASRMGEDAEEGVVPWDYYSQLNPLLGRPRFGRMPPGFDQLRLLWEDLNAWLDADLDGGLGTSTARAWRHVNIGWPLSQCLLREADRRRLSEFFRSVGLEPGLEIESSQLWNLFKNWAHDGCGLSKHGLRVVHEAPREFEEEVAELVFREFCSWDGEVRDARGRTRAEIVLAVDVAAGGRRVVARFIPRRPEEFPVGEWAGPAGPVALESVADDWFGALPGDPTRNQLEHGFALTSRSFSLAYEPSLVVPLRASLDLGTWVSVRQASLFEEHCIVCHESQLYAAERFLERHADRGWTRVPNRGNLPRGWTVIRGVRMSRPVPVAPDELRRLAPRLHTATRLEGGLQVAPRQYLTEGEPDLWVTVEHGASAEVVIDGSPLQLELGALELRLSELDPPLPAGAHEVVAGGIRRTFSSFGGFDVTATAGTGGLGHILERHREYRPSTLNAARLPERGPPRGTIYVCGASSEAEKSDLPIPPTPPVLIPRGFSGYTIIGRDQEHLLALLPPSRPQWLNELSLGEQFFDQPVSFLPHWLILDGKLGTQVRALADPPLAPCATRDWSDGSGAWAAEICRAYEASAIVAAAHRNVWEEYVECALKVVAT